MGINFTLVHGVVFVYPKGKSQTYLSTATSNFKLMLPCIVIDFFLNNQPDPLIIQIYSVITLHVSGILSAHHQEFSTVHSALLSFMQVFDDLTLLGSGHQKPA
jgi:hypothetical protein